MSLILDALRKSEAERRRGQAPDLFASLPLSPVPRRPEWLRFWPGLAFVALLLGAGYLLWHGREESAESQAEALPDVAADAMGETSQSTTSPVPSSQAPIHAPGSRRPPGGLATNANANATAFAPGTDPAVSAPSGGPTRTVIAPPAAIASSSNLPVPLQPTQPIADSTSVVPAAVAPTAPVPDAEAEDEPSESLPPIAVLSASERAALPALKLSMHVFNSEPGKRFAIIDGHRVTEGAALGGSVIEEIRRDGVVLNIDGRRILLPRP